MMANQVEVSKEQFLQAIQAGHETLVELMSALTLTRNQAKSLRDKLVAEGTIEPYAVAVSHARGQGFYKYRITSRRDSALTREGDRIVQAAIGTLRGHSGPFAVLLSTSEENK